MGKNTGYTPPQLLKKQCSCFGGNPNCFKCGGWGYIDALSAGRISTSPAGAPLVPKRKVRCPNCGARVAQLHQHIQRMHSGQLKVHEKADLCICTFCKAPVKESNLSRHMKRVHGGDGVDNKTSTNI